MIKPPVYISGDLPDGQFPELAECYLIWNEKRGDRFAPSWLELDFFAFPVNMIPCCYLVDVTQSRGMWFDFRYRFVGAAVSAVERWDYTGKSVDDLQPPELAPVVRAQFEEFAANPKPSFFTIQEMEMAPLKSDKQIYGGLRLPLSSNGLTMDQFIVFSHFERDQKDLKIYFDELIASYKKEEPPV